MTKKETEKDFAFIVNLVKMATLDDLVEQLLIGNSISEEIVIADSMPQHQPCASMFRLNSSRCSGQKESRHRPYSDFYRHVTPVSLVNTAGPDTCTFVILHAYAVLRCKIVFAATGASSGTFPASSVHVTSKAV